MAQGKLSPRQRMINMMYLVLTALLALNVSKEIINAFVTVNESLAVTRDNVEGKNDLTYAQFKLSMTVDSAKWYKVNDKAQRTKNAADNLVAYIEQLKETLVRRTEGLDENEKVPELRDVNKKENYDWPTTIMCGDKHDGTGAKATELKNQMDAFKTTVLSFFNDNPKTQANFRTRLETSLDTKASANAEDEKRTWEMQKFYHNPVVASVALLTKFQGDVRNTESQIIEHLYTSVDDTVYKPNVFRAEVIPTSSYVLLGQEFKARVFLSATSSTLTPDVYVGAKIDPSTQQMVATTAKPLPAEDGIAVYTDRPSSEGIKKWSGVINIKNPDNTYKAYPFESEYIAAKPTGVISADKMNVLYIGVQNPMSISVPGVSNDKVRTTVNGAGVSLKPDPAGGSGKWIATATTQGECTFTITADFGGRQQTMGTAKYRVKKVPNPIATIADLKGGRISKEILIAQGAIIPKMEDFVFDLYPTITSFRMSLYTTSQGLQEFDGTSNRLTEKMVAELKKARVGDKVYFDFIRAKMPDGPRSLQPINFILN
jgi:gliding motility-associated protein GldM